MASLYHGKGEFERALELFQHALRLNRLIKDRISEGINLGNLGRLYHDLGDPEQAQVHFAQAIQRCDSLNYLIGSGVFRGSLALIQAQQGGIDEALLLLNTGEPQVAVYAMEHGKFLCKKAKALHLARRPAAALEALAQAQSIAAELNTTPDSELTKMITETTQFLEVEP